MAPCHSEATKRTRLCRKINEPTRVDLLNLHLLEALRWGRRHARFWATSSLPLPYGRGAESGRVGRAEQALRPLHAVAGVVLTSRCCGNVLAFCPSVTNAVETLVGLWKKHVYGASSLSAGTGGTVTDITGNQHLKLLKPSNKEGILWEEPWLLGVNLL